MQVARELRLPVRRHPRRRPVRPRERVVPGLLGGRQGHFQGKIGLIYGAIHDASEIGTENRESLRMRLLFRRRLSLMDCVFSGRNFLQPR